MMEYVYAVMWLLVGLILIFRMGKENRVFYFTGAFFLVLGGWWLANALTPMDLFAGTWGLVLRVITAAALVVACLVFWKTYRADQAAFEKKKVQEKEEGQKGTEAPAQDEGDQEKW